MGTGINTNTWRLGYVVFLDDTYNDMEAVSYFVKTALNINWNLLKYKQKWQLSFFEHELKG